MQVFIPYPEPIKTAECLDYRRRNKQILECHWIIDVVEGRLNPSRSHPIFRMYEAPYIDWLICYTKCLENYRAGAMETAKYWSDLADVQRPFWMTNKICDQHKRRLYDKDPDFYKSFEDYGASNINYYVVDGELRKYGGGFVESEPIEEFLTN